MTRYNPKAFLSVGEVDPDFILLTHGHGDHFGQTDELLKKTKAEVVASDELCDFLSKKYSVERLIRIKPSEQIEIDSVKISSFEAKHKHNLEGLLGDILGLMTYHSYVPCGTNIGYQISIEETVIYHSGDTHIVKDVSKPDIAFLSMDGLRTLDAMEALEVTKRIKPKVVIPIHYKWHDTGKETVKELKNELDRGEYTSIKEMKYGEKIDSKVLLQL